MSAPAFPPAPDLAPVRRALISVSDKTGLVPVARALAAMKVQIVSTGGTRSALTAARVPVRDVSMFTGYPEMMDGRVKTLHPAIHGALLGVRDDPGHATAMAEHRIVPIDLLYVSLYPFEATVAAGGDFAACVENIDIGGPAMIRSAAKNHAYVAVCTSLADMRLVLAELTANGATTLALRRQLAARAFAHTAAYDAAIADWFAGEVGDPWPARKTIAGARKQVMRYGENPHQSAALYTLPHPRPGVATARQVQGKALSYNNIADTDAAVELVAEFDPADSAAVAIIKHANPCGVAVGADPREAYVRALQCDPVSAFGGIVALNRRLDAAAAAEIVKIFTEVVIAPEADDEAIALFAAKKNLRLLLTGALPDPTAPGQTFKSVAGGFLVQGRDSLRVTRDHLTVVTRRTPTESEIARHAVRLHRRAPRQVQRHRLRAGRPDRRDRGRSDEPARLGPHRRPARRRSRPGRRPVRVARQGLGLRVRRVLSIPRRTAAGGRGRGHQRRPAGRLGRRQGGDRGRRPGRRRHGLHRRAGLPPLISGRRPAMVGGARPRHAELDNSRIFAQ